MRSPVAVQELTFQRRGSELRTAWEALVSSSPDGWVFATYAWQDVIVAVPRWQLEEHGFAVMRGGELVAVVPLHYVRAERHLASSGFGCAGPVLASGLSPATERSLLGQIHDRIVAIAAELGAESIGIATSPLTPRSLSGRWGVNPLVFHGYIDRSTHTRIVDLSRSEEELWFGLSQSARQAINAARRKGYTVEQSDWPAMLDLYYSVHCETYERTGVMPHPKEYFEGIAHRIAAAGLSFLWTARSPSGAPVAFHNQARFGIAALYHTGCSATEHLKSGVNYLLLWEAMMGARRDGCRWFEVGEVFPGARGGKEEGLSVMKSKFGGEVHRFFRGELPVRAAESVDTATTLSSPNGTSVPAHDERSIAHGLAITDYLRRYVRRLVSGRHV